MPTFHGWPSLQAQWAMRDDAVGRMIAERPFRDDVLQPPRADLHAMLVTGGRNAPRPACNSRVAPVSAPSGSSFASRTGVRRPRVRSGHRRQMGTRPSPRKGAEVGVRGRVRNNLFKYGEALSRRTVFEVSQRVASLARFPLPQGERTAR